MCVGGDIRTSSPGHLVGRLVCSYTVTLRLYTVAGTSENNQPLQQGNYT